MPTPIENNTIQLQQLIEKANSLPSKLILTDDVTGKKYILGIKNGGLYYKEMTEVQEIWQEKTLLR